MTRIHHALAIIAAVLGLAAGAADVAAGGRRAVDVTQLASEIEAERDHVTAPELAERIMRQDSSLRVIDLRSRAEYDDRHHARGSGARHVRSACQHRCLLRRRHALRAGVDAAPPSRLSRRPVPERGHL
jgi:hypothetical protein